ncbi:hypothetical protein [Streptomyces violascens]|uniref:hypothetical protein n=1 Tax=Streptomyces violascens TaxID=67381 RepID=UPI00364DCC66
MIVAEGPLEALVLTGTDSVTRNVEVHDSQQLIHVFPRQVFCRVIVWRGATQHDVERDVAGSTAADNFLQGASASVRHEDIIVGSS